jgi:hypothetical protein
MGELTMPDSTNLVNKRDINSHIPDKFALLCSASFEERSTTIPLSFDEKEILYAKLLRSTKYDNQSATDRISDKIKDIEIVDLDYRHPIAVAKTLTNIIKELSLKKISLVIDITTFTHEVLAMLLKLLYDNKQYFPSIMCLYNGASDYSNSKNIALSQMWLTKGCRDVRNIVGYPGRFRLDAKTCLVIFTGFELERATRLIELLGPDKIIFGRGKDPTNPNHKEAMDYFRGKFDEWKNNYKYSNCTDIPFSCKDIDETIKNVTDLVTDNPDDNFILVPLNTKLSTIAISIVALNNARIQICYSIPETYNIKDYSSPSNDITIIDLLKIDMFFKQ